MSHARQTHSGFQHGPAEQSFHSNQSAALAEVHGHAADAAIRRMAAEGQQSENEPFPPGTEVWVHRSLGYHHAGVYVGNGEVVQVHGEPMDAMKGLKHASVSVPVSIDRVPLAQFAKGGHVQIGPAGTAHDPRVAVERALSKVGSTWEYNVLTHNCQHFASWCITGKEVSPEAQAFERACARVLDAPGEAAREVLHGAENVVHGIGSALHRLHW